QARMSSAERSCWPASLSPCPAWTVGGLAPGDAAELQPLLEAFAADAGGLGGDEGEAAGADEGGDAPQLFGGRWGAPLAFHEPSASRPTGPGRGGLCQVGTVPDEGLYERTQGKSRALFSLRSRFDQPGVVRCLAR